MVLLEYFSSLKLVFSLWKREARGLCFWMKTSKVWRTIPFSLQERWGGEGSEEPSELPGTHSSATCLPGLLCLCLELSRSGTPSFLLPEADLGPLSLVSINNGVIVFAWQCWLPEISLPFTEVFLLWTAKVMPENIWILFISVARSPALSGDANFGLFAQQFFSWNTTASWMLSVLPAFPTFLSW